LVLLTDGHTYGDEQICYNLAQQVADENIVINVMGIGHEWNDAFLDRLSSLSGGSSIFVSTPKDLYNYLEHKMQSAETVFGRGVRLEFTCDPNVELTYAFRLQPELGPLELASPILIGNLMFGKNISILLEFVVHSVHQGVSQINLLDGKMTMEVPSMTPPMRRVFVKLNRQVKAELTRELPPAMIVDALSKLTLYRMQDKARREVSEGKIEDATRHLQQLATHLLAKGNRELAHTVLVEAEQIHQNHHFSKDGDKKIKYGTRALLMLPGPEQTRS
jgi:Ca-activated chloride channel family protein